MFSVAIAINTPKIMYCTCELLKHIYATLVSDECFTYKICLCYNNKCSINIICAYAVFVSRLKCSGLLEILCSVQRIYSGFELIGGGIFDTETSHYF